MQVASADLDLDLLDRFAVVVDPNAEPVDLDEVLAEFLLKDSFQATISADPAAECRSTPPEQKELS